MGKKKQSGAGQRRKEQKRIALESGFTPEQANKMRDYSSERFQETLRSRRIQSVPPTQRGFLDPKREIRREKAKGIETNKDLWSLWAKQDDGGKAQFPSWIQKIVDSINDSAGMPKDDRYGWRAAYHHFVVDGLDESDLDDITDETITFAESYETLASA